METQQLEAISESVKNFTTTTSTKLEEQTSKLTEQSARLLAIAAREHDGGHRPQEENSRPAQHEQAAEHTATFGTKLRRVAHDLAALRGGEWPERYLINQGAGRHGGRL